MSKYGVNGNLAENGWMGGEQIDGVEYLGDGDWELDDGITVSGGAEDNWEITLADGETIPVWTEE